MKIGYFSLEPRVVDHVTQRIRDHLQVLWDVDWVRASSLEDPALDACELLVVNAAPVDAAVWIKWLTHRIQKVEGTPRVWVPYLVVADAAPREWVDIWKRVVESNFYFDIVASDHLASLPVRVANLMRIHAHLRELQRYASEVDALRSEVRALEARMSANGNT